MSVDFQLIVNKYEAALKAPRLLFDLYPRPRPVGRPPNRYLPLPGSVTLGVIGAFEGFAEDLLAAAMIEQGRGWSHVAQNADLTNPSVKTLVDKLAHACGIVVQPAATWSTLLPKQTAPTAWADRPTSWGDLLARAEGWIQVRHCLAHGLVTGLGAEVWPGPTFTKAVSNSTTRPSANDADVLAEIRGHPDKRALYLWPSIACARIFSVGAGIAAEAVAAAFSKTVTVSGLDLFSDV